jgi:ATP-binding cassette subfamily B protein
VRDEVVPAADVDAPLRRVLSTYGRAHLPEFLLGGVASALSIALELLPSYLLGVAIDVFFTDARPFSLPFVPDPWLPTAVREQFVLLVGLAFACYLAAASLAWINSWAWNHFAQHLQHEVRTAAYRAMQDLELAFFEGSQTGELMSVLNNDVNQLEEFLTTSLHNAMRIATRVVVIGAIMLWLNWQLALVSLAVVPVLVAVSVLFVRRIRPRYSAVREQVGSLNARLENNLAGIETVKAYTNEAFENERVAAASRSYLGRQWDAIRIRIAFFPVVRAITATGYTVTFLLGGWWVLFGPPLFFTKPLSAGVLVTFLLYSRRFRYPMRRVGEVLDDYQYARAAAARILGAEERRPRLPEADDALALTDLDGRVRYEDVSFRYPGSDEFVLEDVSFAVDAGDFVGVVGPTGAGKTTLLKLLLRFYDVDAGAVRLDGHDVRDITRDSLRDAVGYVSQEPYLFHGTVAENVRYGREGADRAAIVAACRRAGAHEFVTDLPDGYETTVGERGVKLSGGQRQRLAIARALLTAPDLFVLDEATSHVDNETETVIRRQLAELTADRTTFAIAHRLSTVRDADTILVFDDGRLVERGTHEELLDRDGLYADLWAVQVGAVEDLPARFTASASASLSERTD